MNRQTRNLSPSSVLECAQQLKATLHNIADKYSQEPLAYNETFTDNPTSSVDAKQVYRNITQINLITRVSERYISNTLKAAYNIAHILCYVLNNSWSINILWRIREASSLGRSRADLIIANLNYFNQEDHAPYIIDPITYEVSMALANFIHEFKKLRISPILIGLIPHNALNINTLYDTLMLRINIYHENQMPEENSVTIAQK